MRNLGLEYLPEWTSNYRLKSEDLVFIEYSYAVQDFSLPLAA